MEKVRTGKQIVSDFIDSLKENTSLNQDVVLAVSSLYEQAKISDKAITNELENLRKQQLYETSTSNS